MNYRKKAVLLVLISLFFVLGLQVQQNESKDIELLITSFKSVDAELDNYWLHLGVPYGEYTNDNQLLQLGNKLSEIFLLPANDKLESFNNLSYYATTGSWGNGTKVELQLKPQNDENNNLYLIFRLIGDGDLDTMAQYYNDLSTILVQNDIPLKINSCIQGNINDKLSNVDQFVLIENILHILTAKEVEKLDTALVKSVSAYSAEFDNYIMTNGQKMNLQIATHVDNMNKKTVITLGTPIITVEY